MITNNNLKALLEQMGFIKNQSVSGVVYTKSFAGNAYSISVDFSRKKIIYPERIRAGRDTTKNFSENENFVVLECVCSLLDLGYLPQHIELEPKTPGGREDGYYYGDVLVKDNNEDPYLLVECKTAGEEYEKELRKTQNHGGAAFSLL